MCKYVRNFKENGISSIRRDLTKVAVQRHPHPNSNKFLINKVTDGKIQCEPKQSQ